MVVVGLEAYAIIPIGTGIRRSNSGHPSQHIWIIGDQLVGSDSNDGAWSDN